MGSLTAWNRRPHLPPSNPRKTSTLPPSSRGFSFNRNKQLSLNSTLCIFTYAPPPAAAAQRPPPPQGSDDDGLDCAAAAEEEEERGRQWKLRMGEEGRGEEAELREDEKEDRMARVAAVLEANLPEGSSAIITACLIGLLTGISVVLFNNVVHEIRDFFWDGIPYRGASWLREQPFEQTWKQTIFVPTCGGIVVSLLNVVQESLEGPASGVLLDRLKVVLKPLLKSLAACATLGTGNSLGPEGPSVEIGSSIAKGVGTVLDKGAQRKVSLTAAGSAAGISSGFNAAVAGCFFGVESVLWPSPADSSASLTNTTSMVILSAVIASVLSQVGLGSEPAFKVPDYDFRSPSELPLYLLLGIICGLVSLALSRSTSYMLATVERTQQNVGVPRALFPIIGSFAVGLIALAYPEILYWGFENVDILLESRPFVTGLSADLLCQLVAVKVVATSLCRASGLVGGYYAPSLFIGAATGMAYGKLIALSASQSHQFIGLSFFEVASPQAYGLVGMAATLAGVCQVPLTSVLLLFELTQDYRIVLPLLGAVGLSCWITSSRTRRMVVGGSKNLDDEDSNDNEQMKPSAFDSGPTLSGSFSAETSSATDLCKVESSLCLDDSDFQTEELQRRISVAEAMRTRYVTVHWNTLLIDAVTLMLAEKQPCALIVDGDNILIGFLSLADIQQFCRNSETRGRGHQALLVGEMCSLDGNNCRVPGTATPSMNLLSADKIMTRYRLNQLPVVSEHGPDSREHLVGIIDRECIMLACRAVAAKESLSRHFISEARKLR
ncbi:hypothetical protein Dimus_029941 [Dionaea muscipula]